MTFIYMTFLYYPFVFTFFNVYNNYNKKSRIINVLGSENKSNDPKNANVSLCGRWCVRNQINRVQPLNKTINIYFYKRFNYKFRVLISATSIKFNIMEQCVSIHNRSVLQNKESQSVKNPMVKYR